MDDLRYNNVLIEDLMGDPGYYLEEYFDSETKEGIKASKFTFCKFVGFETILFNLKEKAVIEDLKVIQDDVVERDITFKSVGENIEIKLDKKIDLTSYYKVIVNGQLDSACVVSIRDLYDTEEFNNTYVTDKKLGAFVENDKTVIRFWAPISKDVKLLLYKNGTPECIRKDGDDHHDVYEMKCENGLWTFELDENLHGLYYTFVIQNYNNTYETNDPSAFACGINGIRSMICDFRKIDEQVNYQGINWNNIYIPEFSGLYTDSIIYELHVRDVSTHKTWNGPDKLRGKFLGVTHEGTSYNGLTTGFDHIKELNVTHVQLLPFFASAVVDERFVDNDDYNGFNWGYMPGQYNTPEGSYTTNPYDGIERIKEFKKMLLAFNQNNMRVTMDVVYNHTGFNFNSNFNRIIPGYYHRIKETGQFSNGSGCRNEFADERPMVRKYMLDSIEHWLTEYHIKGLRFDLMGCHTLDTMKAIKDLTTKIDPTIMVYGEPWKGGESICDVNIQANKQNLDDNRLDGIAAFNDIARDGVRGDVFILEEKGFTNGNLEFKDKVVSCSVGCIPNDNIEDKENIWSKDPQKSINYVSCHDNSTLFDKNCFVFGYMKGENHPHNLPSEEESNKLDIIGRQANAIILTSQGIPFLHAGVEFNRTKFGVHNSYQSPDDINQINWEYKHRYNETVEYYKGLINIRRNISELKYKSAENITNNITFKKDIMSDSTIAYEINDKYLIIHNVASKREISIDGTYNVLINKDFANIKSDITVSNLIEVNKNETILLKKQ